MKVLSILFIALLALSLYLNFELTGFALELIEENDVLIEHVDYLQYELENKYLYIETQQEPVETTQQSI